MDTGTVTSRGWTPPVRPLSYGAWAAEGKRLREQHQGVLWAVGDWLNYGERAFGEKYAQAASDTGYNPEFLRQVSFVARRFPPDERTPQLTFSHHRRVASLEPATRKALLVLAGESGWTSGDLHETVKELANGGVTSKVTPLSDAEIVTRAREIRQVQIATGRTERRDRINAMTAANTPLPLNRRYPFIYADPAWRHSVPMGVTPRAAEDKYPTMPVEEICAVPVTDLATESAVLAVWERPGMRAEADRVIRAWDFTYLGEIVWVKDKIGLGFWTRNQHEKLLICTRGDVPPPDEAVRPSSVLHAARGRHSEKPDEVYAILDGMFPYFEKIEIFARDDAGTARPDSWAAWGNQARAA